MNTFKVMLAIAFLSGTAVALAAERLGVPHRQMLGEYTFHQAQSLRFAVGHQDGARMPLRDATVGQRLPHFAFG